MSVSIEQIESIYIQYRKAQGNYTNKGFRLPKDFESFFNSRIKKQNREALIKITGWFITKWQNIDPLVYFECGFELYKKGFTYVMFFRENIIKLYKTRDKNKKREIEITKKGLIDSAVFVKKWMDKNNCNLNEYINMKEDNKRLAVDHYLKNKIDASFFVFLIGKGMDLTDDDRTMIPYISDNFRKIKFGLNDIQDFLNKLERKL
jgi:hypothetical protein